MKKETVEKIYAGWLGKTIGVIHGSPIEGFWYGRIKETYGEIKDYLVKYEDYASDDDLNGPLFFLKGMDDSGHGQDTKAQDVANALLNYAPYEHSFFWWGGYGRSTEHTAYLNLRNGIPAPRSGSIAQNGATVAEQIGGQIFIDTWGLVAPGNPELAAKLAKEAASVTHDGNGIYGGIFVAVCVSLAFVENNVRTIIEKALKYIPKDCEYARVVNAVLKFHNENPDNWRACYLMLRDEFGYSKYPGNCHIIPNAGVVALSLVYGNGDYSDTINIGLMCGWDTDCNVGNAASIVGVMVGLKGIKKKWKDPVHDFLVFSSCLGSQNIQDIPEGALYIAKLACDITGDKLPKPYRSAYELGHRSCHFEFPGSTHSMRTRVVDKEGNVVSQENLSVSCNTSSEARTGKRSLKVEFKDIKGTDAACIYKKTYLNQSDFTDSRYDPSFSPIAYPGQTVSLSLKTPEGSEEVYASVFVRDRRSGKVYESRKTKMSSGSWYDLSYKIPKDEGLLVFEIGAVIRTTKKKTQNVTVFLDDLVVRGKPDYTLDFSKESMEIWKGTRGEVSQVTKLKGIIYLEEGQMNLSCENFTEAYTGDTDFEDYKSTFAFTPCFDKASYGVNVRVQGAMRSYRIALNKDNTFSIEKNEYGYRTLASTQFVWEAGKEYVISVTAKGNTIKAECEGVKLSITDKDNPYLNGAVGVSMYGGSHIKVRKISVKGF